MLEITERVSERERDREREGGAKQRTTRDQLRQSGDEGETERKRTTKRARGESV